MSLIGDLKAAMSPKPRPSSGLRCRVCGWAPASAAYFTTIPNLAIRTRLTRREGPYCRDCGIALFRNLTAHALPGWWYPRSFFVLPLLVVTNLIQRRRVAVLPAPARQGPAVSAGVRALNRLSGTDVPARDAPLLVGPPLYLRWQMIGVLAPLLMVVAIVILTIE